MQNDHQQTTDRTNKLYIMMEGMYTMDKKKKQSKGDRECQGGVNDNFKSSDPGRLLH